MVGSPQGSKQLLKSGQTGLIIVRNRFIFIKQQYTIDFIFRLIVRVFLALRFKVRVLFFITLIAPIWESLR